MEWHYVDGSWIKSHSEGILAEQITGNIRGCCNYVYRMMTSYIKGTARVVNRVPTLRLGQVR